MRNKEYNWWADPKNAEEVKRYSWWDHSECKQDYYFPISVAESDGSWTASFNSETKELVGDNLHGCASSRISESDAISKLWALVKMQLDYEHGCSLNYQRFVPFRKGPWQHKGGRWISIFGIHIYFRNGDGMKGGWYIPFTKFNISVNSDWSIYKRWKKKNN